MKRRMMLATLPLATVLCVALTGAPAARADEAGAGYLKVKEYVTAAQPARQVLSPEGEFIAVYNDDVVPWVENPLDLAALEEIRKAMAPHLRIDLNERGFAPAATRATEGAADTTHYDAIWVRDNVWIHYALRADPARKDDARKLILALWDYYASDAQIARFRNVIANPSLATDAMAMPHIRFDGASPTLADVMVDGKPEVWNHRQIDAHGLFFAALGEAALSGLITPDDLTSARMKALGLYPLFLEKIAFWQYEDAGAWEELPRRNTSSIGIATRSLQVWKRILYGEIPDASRPFRDRVAALLRNGPAAAAKMWLAAGLDDLIARGLRTVTGQLALGGESPAYPPDDIHFRLADAALIFLIQPSPLEGIGEERMRQALLIVETLRRPMGVLRYRNDSYQGGNYWIRPPSQSAEDAAGPAPTGDTSSREAFLWRLGKLIPDTEAQWFFDSLLALARLHLAGITENEDLRRQDIHAATVHLKRALGQITGEAIAADGKPVGRYQMPESVNTVIVDGRRYYLPSPITPLNWSKAALAMALREYEKVAPGGATVKK